VYSTIPARAALLAYAAACRSGAGTNVAVDVALARYRAFFPLAPEWRIRSILAHALAVERLRGRGAIHGPGGAPIQRTGHGRLAAEEAADVRAAG
jgi:hypothetical protein